MHVYQASTKQELADLEAQSQLPLEELLQSLPQEVLEKPASLEPSDNESEQDGEGKADGKEKVGLL